MLGKWEIDVLRDDSGTAITVDGAHVEVRRESDGALADLYAEQDEGSPGPDALNNPFTVAGNTVLFYAEQNDTYRIVISQGSFSRTLRYVSVGTPPISHYIAENIFPCETLAEFLSALGLDDLGTAATLNYSTDGTFAANSDALLATQKAVKTYVDTGLATKQAADAGLTSLAGLTATGKIYYLSAADTWSEVTIGSGITFSSGTLSVASPVLKGYLFGLTLSNNGSDPTNDIDIAAGFAVDSTAAVTIAGTAMTKRLDANWAAGTGNGFRNSAVAIANTTYHIYAVSKASGADPDYYAHTSTTIATVIAALQAETGGSSYIYARRIGSILRVSNTIRAFDQFGDEFWIDTAILDVDATDPGTSAVTRTLSVPAGINVQAIMNVVGSGCDVYLSSLANTDSAPNFGGNPGTTVQNTGGVQARVWTNTSSQIRSRVSASGSGEIIRIATLGWRDHLGRMA